MPGTPVTLKRENFGAVDDCLTVVTARGKTTLPDSASVREFARLQIAFAHCLRMTLRKQPQAEVLAHYLKTEDLQRVLASNSPANRILLIMGEWLAVQRRNGQLSDILFISLNDRLNDISAVRQDASALPIRQFPLPTP